MDISQTRLGVIHDFLQHVIENIFILLKNAFLLISLSEVLFSTLLVIRFVDSNITSCFKRGIRFKHQRTANHYCFLLLLCSAFGRAVVFSRDSFDWFIRFILAYYQSYSMIDSWVLLLWSLERTSHTGYYSTVVGYVRTYLFILPYEDCLTSYCTGNCLLLCITHYSTVLLVRHSCS